MDKVAIITAASRGMGAAITRKLHEDGFKCVLLSRSEEVEVLAEEVSGNSIRGTVESEEALQALVNLAIQEHGRVDVIVNNTGHSAKGDLLMLSDEAWSSGFELLFMNVVRMARAVTPLFVEQGEGSIINISSFAAFEPSPEYPISSVVRSALSSYVKLYSKRYAGKGIRMNNILPGFIDSYPVTDEIREQIPANRPGKVEEVAELVSFLASDKSAYVNGENIRIDGGLSRSL